LESLVEVSLEFDRIEHAMNLFGNFDENINIIEDAFNVKIISRDNEIRVVGYSDAVYKAQTVLQRLIAMAAQGDIISKQNVSYFVQLAEENQLDKIKGFTADFVCLTARGRQIKAKTHGQKVYVDAIKENDIVFGIGPAGTGKTFLAVAMAVNAILLSKYLYLMPIHCYMVSIVANFCIELAICGVVLKQESQCLRICDVIDCYYFNFRIPFE